MTQKQRHQKRAAQTLDRGKAAALFYGCESLVDAQERYAELSANPDFQNPHAKQLLRQQFEKAKLRVYEDETSRMHLLQIKPPKPTDLASLVAMLQTTQPTMLAAALEQVQLQASKKADKDKPVPMPTPAEPQAPTPTPVVLPDAVEPVAQAPMADEDDGWEWSDPTKDKVVVQSVDMPNAGFIQSAAPTVPVEAAEFEGVTKEKIDAIADEIIHDEAAAVAFPLGAGSRWYVEQWQFFSDDEKWENCIAFLADIGGRGGLDRAVLARRMHPNMAAEVVTLRDRKKSEAGKKGARTRKANTATK
jgi:hypothetical protein